MKRSFLLMLGLLVGSGAVSAEPLVDGDRDAGQQRAAACAACHGPKGNMESAQFPKLAGQGAPYIYEQLKRFKSGKRQNPIMAGQVAGLNDADMKNLAVYFSAQQTKPGVADEAIAPLGAQLYHAGDAERGVPACSGCHGPSGLGNPAAAYPRLSGQNPGYVATQLTAYRDDSRSGYRNAAIMNAVAARLTDKEIKALAAYVSGLAPAGADRAGGHGALMRDVAAANAAQAAKSDSGD